MDERIAELVRRLADDPFFLASALNEYRNSEGWDDQAMARFLGCAVEALPAIALCRRPRADPPHFRRDVDRIAARFGLESDALAEVVRRADTLAAMRRPVADGRGQLMAARDREEDQAGPREDRP